MSVTATFKIDYHQFLDENGEAHSDLPGGKLPAFADNPADLVPLYRLMVLTRLFDAKAIALQRTGKLGTYASSLGHEATHVGIGAAMREEDCLAPMYREYGAQFYRGVKMSDVLLYWGGDERGNDFSVPSHDFSWCVPIATQCLHAAGAAVAFKYLRQPRVAVTVVGDGGTSEGQFYEAMNLAGAWKLPVVFVVSNNQWAISVPRSAQSAAQTLAQKAIAAGIPGVQVDGNDLIAVRWAMEEALERARKGDGPSMIEALTYRLSDHTTADDATRYRENAEVEEARRKEPLSRTRKFLEAQGVWDAKQQEALEAECAKQVDAAVAEYENTPVQAPEAIFDYMFANMPESLKQQRDQHVKEMNDG
ncbi:MAG: pyruvate dehydrogenase (acetyl-transferring) E1 component subunit alpha [Gammaproteobacteria bacterium]|nr:MAG: pyruvate dehydrogenase (acetyl-transferring) E1 component subunit alpha [Gammaproteobacteria bacterium]